jgi:hypothetical protein
MREGEEEEEEVEEEPTQLHTAIKQPSQQNIT